MHVMASTEPRRLVVVQKDLFTAKAMARLLRRHFTAIEIAATPSDAERLLAAAPHHKTVIVCGERFANGEPSGLTWLQRVRTFHHHITRLVLATSLPLTDGLRDLVDAVVQKPFDPAEFRRSVLGACEGSPPPLGSREDEPEQKADNLGAYVSAVFACLDAAVQEPSFDASQRALLQRTIDRPRAKSRLNPFGDPLSLVYLIARAYGRAIDEHAIRVGAFALLYVLSLDLFDDVQDDDLAGKPHEDAGAPIAINSAISLLILAGRELLRAAELETDPARRLLLLEIYCKAGTDAVGGQHRDLMGKAGASSPAEVLAMQAAKTSSVAMLTECGALLGRANETDFARFSRVGASAAMFVQVRDDLRDIFGKNLSPDLMTGKWTYPIASFWEQASDEEKTELEELTGKLPDSIRSIRGLFYRSGAVENSAAKLEELRSSIHDEIKGTGLSSGYLRTLLAIFDGLAETVYAPPQLEKLPVQRVGFHLAVQLERDRFLDHMSLVMKDVNLSLPEPPTFEPWHLPQWMYVPEKRTIFYPDLEDLSAEILPFQAALLGEEDLSKVKQTMTEQLPAVLAHEMFHFLRDQAGRLTNDHWHEEWAANRLAVAYAAQFAPETARSTLELVRIVKARFAPLVEAHAPEVLARCRHESPDTTGYQMDMMSVAAVSMEMLHVLISESPRLTFEVHDLLGGQALRAA